MQPLRAAALRRRRTWRAPNSLSVIPHNLLMHHGAVGQMKFVCRQHCAYCTLQASCAEIETCYLDAS